MDKLATYIRTEQICYILGTATVHIVNTISS